MHRLLVFLALVAAPASAQPSGEALLEAWWADWDAAIADVEAVALDETLQRSVEGPRGTLALHTEGSVRVAPQRRPRRTVRRAVVNGEPIEPSRLREMEHKMRHALGRAAMDLRRPAALPARTLRGATPRGAVEADRLGGVSAWRLTLDRASRRGPPERLTVWFSPSRTAPRLLRLDRERALPDGGHLHRSTTYVRAEGLDLPSTHTVRAQIEQRRRLRTYALSLDAEATYRDATVERDE